MEHFPGHEQMKSEQNIRNDEAKRNFAFKNTNKNTGGTMMMMMTCRCA
jgi:hypothetical protein